ncbi:hypothetical protein ABTY61_23420 [Kitasatospora sp. NPDC096128]|uniref:hypothetical protein n=1 Tax=Kitasatospora sp. NPDC096128 TaxID=3155547 RepID=UPI00332188AD
MILAAQRQFRAAWMRIRDNTRLLELWRTDALEDGSRQWRIGQILDHLARTGEVQRPAAGGGRNNEAVGLLLGGTEVEQWGRLFLTRLELASLAVLLTDRFGWNLSVYNRMPAPSSAVSAGESRTVTYQVSIEKRRAGAGRWFSSENITDSGAQSPGRLITQALEATLHGRTLAADLVPGTDLLMVARSAGRLRDHRELDRPRPVGRLSLGLSHSDVKRWAASHGLNGSPFQRVRRGTVVREGRPLQHSRGTHESIYVLPDAQVQHASRKVFEDGALDALDRARSVVFAGRLAEVPDPDGQETATADCMDASTSPWPDADGGCAADFLLCLACPNAHVHPGHHPRLALLHERLEGLRGAVPDETWTGRWAEHLLRLENLRERIGPAAWGAARTRAGDRDRIIANLLLKGDLAP